jgi:hypothetical protein
MRSSERDRGGNREARQAEAPRPDGAREEPLAWASKLGNSAVQAIAGSAPGRAAPVAPESLPAATGVLARQADSSAESEDASPDEYGIADAQAVSEADQDPVEAPPEVAPETELGSAGSEYALPDVAETADHDADE